MLSCGRRQVHWWGRMLERGVAASAELAAAECIGGGGLSRILRLTLLAPDIAAAILDGSQPDGAGLPTLVEPFPAGWSEQRQAPLGARAVH